jgi:D-methionine transport system permease protein
MFEQLLIATGETLYMTIIASLVAILFGLPLGIFLFLSGKNQVLANKGLHQLLSLLVNIGRSIPFVILMIAVIPFTRLIVGTSIGTNAAIVPLAVAAIPFFARMVESALLEISYGLIEAALAMGATTDQIIVKILLPEARSGIIQSITITIIALIGYSAMAGAVGGGGLGDLAVRYGYQRFDVTVMIETIVILVAMVQLVQMAGDYWVKKLSHR